MLSRNLTPRRRGRTRMQFQILSPHRSRDVATDLCRIDRRLQLSHHRASRGVLRRSAGGHRHVAGGDALLRLFLFAAVWNLQHLGLPRLDFAGGIPAGFRGHQPAGRVGVGTRTARQRATKRAGAVAGLWRVVVVRAG